jgi:hypothetical protein
VRAEQRRHAARGDVRSSTSYGTGHVDDTITNTAAGDRGHLREEQRLRLRLRTPEHAAQSAARQQPGRRDARRLRQRLRPGYVQQGHHDRRRQRHHRHRGRQGEQPGDDLGGADRQQLRARLPPGHQLEQLQTDCDNNGGPGSIQIDAAILALNHSFINDNWYCGNPLGTLTLNGAIAQKFRGTVSTFSSGSTVATGYAKDYNYNRTLRYREPPFFIAPTESAWKIVRQNEQVPAR